MQVAVITIGFCPVEGRIIRCRDSWLGWTRQRCSPARFGCQGPSTSDEYGAFSMAKFRRACSHYDTSTCTQGLRTLYAVRRDLCLSRSRRGTPATQIRVSRIRSLQHRMRWEKLLALPRAPCVSSLCLYVHALRSLNLVWRGLYRGATTTATMLGARFSIFVD